MAIEVFNIERGVIATMFVREEDIPAQRYIVSAENIETKVRICKMTREGADFTSVMHMAGKLIIGASGIRDCYARIIVNEDIAAVEDKPFDSGILVRFTIQPLGGK